MRVLIATEFGSMVGGRETYLRAVGPLLRRSGFEVGYAFEQPGRGEVAGDTPGPVWTLPADRQRVVAWRPDIVYLHGQADPVCERWFAERFATVYFPHGYYGTCVSGTKCYARLGYQPCRRTLGPGCLATYLTSGCGGRNPLTMLGMYRSQRQRLRTFRQYSAVVVASRHMQGEYRRHGVENPQLLPLFPPDVVPDPAPPVRRAATGRVLFVGRIVQLKGLLHLVAAARAAMAKLGRRLTLVVAGDGPDRAEAESAANLAGLPAEFLGWVGTDRVAAEMRAADVLAVPSLWPEPFGLVGVEAGCFGLPAVGYATGGIPDWLEPGVSGESAPGGRPEPGELAAAVVRAVGDDAHRHRLAIGAWETARRFSPDMHLALLSEILRAVSAFPTPAQDCLS